MNRLFIVTIIIFSTLFLSGLVFPVGIGDMMSHTTMEECLAHCLADAVATVNVDRIAPVSAMYTFVVSVAVFILLLLSTRWAPTYSRAPSGEHSHRLLGIMKRE